MPFTGFLCEAEEAKGMPVPADECAACARRGAIPGCHVTAPVINGIVKGMRPDYFGLSVTALLGCLRKRRLMQVEDYWLAPSEAWWAYRGQLMHGISAEYAAGDRAAVAETRYSLTLDGVPVSGQPDLVLLDRRHLVDYKTAKSVPGPWRTWACPATGAVIRESAFAWRNKWMDCPHCGESHEAKAIETVGAPRAYERHARQVNLYRLILHENGLDIETAEIVYQDMRQQLRIPVELMPLAEARAFLRERLALFAQAELPGVLITPDELWECDYCPVRAACEKLHGGPVGKNSEQ
jgi:CRISPR/Cas system-associated exonuclease Cas4 (RecB family)